MSDEELKVEGIDQDMVPEEPVDLSTFFVEDGLMFPHVFVQLAYDPTALAMAADQLSKENDDIVVEA